MITLYTFSHPLSCVMIETFSSTQTRSTAHCNHPTQLLNACEQFLHHFHFYQSIVCSLASFTPMKLMIICSLMLLAVFTSDYHKWTWLTLSIRRHRRWCLLCLGGGLGHALGLVEPGAKDRSNGHVKRFNSRSSLHLREKKAKVGFCSLRGNALRNLPYNRLVAGRENSE